MVLHLTLQAQNDAENEKRVTHLLNYFDRPLYNRNRRYVIQVGSHKRWNIRQAMWDKKKMIRGGQVVLSSNSQLSILILERLFGWHRGPHPV